MERIALISVHTSPLAALGGRKAGGMNVYVRESATELTRLGYAVDIFTRDDGTLPTVLTLPCGDGAAGQPSQSGVRGPSRPGVRVISLPAGPRRPLEKDELEEHLPGFLNALRAFREREGLRYALVHSHYWMSGWVGRHLQRLWDVPHVTMFHTLGEVKRRARAEEEEPEQRIEAERLVAITADRIVAASGHERGMLERLYGVGDERVSVIPCGVNLERFRPQERTAARASVGLPDDRPIVLFVGRLEPLKGLELLIDAVAALEQSAPELVVVGGDAHAAAYMATLRARAEARGLGARTRFVGAAPQEQLPAYYSAADVCVVPSYYESFGLVALEAMACGTPVLAARVGGLTSIIQDGVNGYLLPWRCPEAFAAKIDLVLTDEALRRSLGVAARKRAQRFRWSVVTAELDALYRRVIEERAAEGCHAVGTAAVAAAGCHS